MKIFDLVFFFFFLLSEWKLFCVHFFDRHVREFQDRAYKRRVFNIMKYYAFLFHEKIIIIF
jgi:hypothetical protein